MAKHNIFGQKGENAAFEALLAKGYLIRDRNWRSGKNEIDIVAEKDNRIIVVEVKSRSHPIYDISQVITRDKIRHLDQCRQRLCKDVQPAARTAV